MSDETTVVPNDPGFVPEPIPDNIADTEINGLDPVQTDEVAEVKEVNEETNDDQPTVETEVEEPADEPETPEEAPVVEQQPDAKELARQQFEQRQQAKQERDYVREQRQQIREYEQNSDTSDLEERLKIMEAKDYVNTVERNRASISRDVSAAREIPFFKTGSQQSELLLNQSLENYANAYGITDPDTGEWIAAQDRNGNDVPLLPFLQQQAATYEQAVATATQQVQKSEAKMRAKAVNPSNTGKVATSGDDLQDLLDKVGDTQLW